MKLLYSYLRRYWGLVALALVLAAINQVFSLLDPLIFRHVIDEYATRFSEYTTEQFFRGVSLLLAAAVGVAFVSRVAKNFQDYFINVITQRLGARALLGRHPRTRSSCPTRCSRTSAAARRWASSRRCARDVEKLIAIAINMLFTSLVGIVFVMIYAFTRALAHRAGLSS